MKRTQYIYILINPDNEEIFYVGCTVNPKGRYSSHCSPKKGRQITPKDEYISSHMITPVMKIVQKVSDGLGCNREKLWIKRLRKQGHPLTNYNMIIESYAYNRRYR